MIVLPRGITGFTNRKDPPLPVSIEKRQFRTDCYQVARQCNAAVRSIDEPSGVENFRTTEIAIGDENILILLNVHFPYLAMAQVRHVGDLTLNFIDVPALASAFSAIDRYQVLTADDLAHPINESMVGNLSKAELHQMNYWKPQTMGEVIFNYWD
ncbi:hypothetical protein [Symmachiella dynata]|uniref:hypothetical protein n=1 Tax=Symmachiella dynata TaxID=2527995 RepID=UPI0030EE29E1